MKNEQKEKVKCNEDSKETKEESREFLMSKALIMSKH